MRLFLLSGQKALRNKILRMLLDTGCHSGDKYLKQCMKEIMSRINLVQRMKLYPKEKNGSECLCSVTSSHSLTLFFVGPQIRTFRQSSEGISALQALLMYSGRQLSWIFYDDVP
jgi:hypothetical protein